MERGEKATLAGRGGGRKGAGREQRSYGAAIKIETESEKTWHGPFLKKGVNKGSERERRGACFSDHYVFANARGRTQTLAGGRKKLGPLGRKAGSNRELNQSILAEKNRHLHMGR